MTSGEFREWAEEAAADWGYVAPMDAQLDLIYPDTLSS